MRREGGREKENWLRERFDGDADKQNNYVQLQTTESSNKAQQLRSLSQALSSTYMDSGDTYHVVPQVTTVPLQRH